MTGKLISVLTPTGFTHELIEGLQQSLVHQGFEAEVIGLQDNTYTQMEHLLNEKEYSKERVYNGILEWASQARRQSLQAYELLLQNKWVLWNNQLCPYLLLNEFDPKRDELLSMLRTSDLYAPSFIKPDHTFLEYSMKWVNATTDEQRQLAVGTTHHQRLVNNAPALYQDEVDQGNFTNESLATFLAGINRMDPKVGVSEYWGGQWRLHSKLCDWASLNKQDLLCVLEMDCEDLFTDSPLDTQLFRQACAEHLLFAKAPELTHSPKDQLRLSHVFQEGVKWLDSLKPANA